MDHRLLIKQHSRLLMMSLAIFLWILARAQLQSITIDEADTYLAWVSRTAPNHWHPAANNHVLNSALMRLSTSLFGVTHLSTRAPALLGAAIYIAASALLSALIFNRSNRRWQCVLLTLLTCNPFIQDHLVAARGYSLALGFTAIQLAILLLALKHPRPSNRMLAAASLAAGLAICSNFSFLVVSCLTATAILSIYLLRSEGTQSRLILLATGLAVVLFFCGSTLARWHEVDLVFGAHSLSQTATGLYNSTFYELNPNLVNPLLYPKLACLPRILTRLLPLLGLLIASSALGQRIPWGLLTFSAILAGTILVHWTLHHMTGMLLPLDRTAVYIPLLLTLIFASLCELGTSRLPVQYALRGTLATLALYFLLCGRLTFFKEWKFDADTRAAYDVLAYYYHQHGLRDAATSWRYDASLKYYQALSGHERFPDFSASFTCDRYPTGKSAYVLYWPEDESFARSENLTPVFRGVNSDLVVAVRTP